jgi:DNA-binding transcriptional LysR family regulator
MVLGVSESLLASWAPEALSAVLRELPGIELKLNAHRSPVAVDLVRAGEYALALVAGHADIAPDLCAEQLGVEPMVLIASRRERPKLRRGKSIEVLTIEPQSATWRSLKEGLQTLKRERGLEFEVVHTLQSFSAIVQMARAGFGHALVPLGIARAMGVTAANIVQLPAPGLARAISIFGRKTAFQRPEVAALTRALQTKINVSLLAKQLRARG